jgi:hypothetical protein
LAIAIVTAPKKAPVNNDGGDDGVIASQLQTKDNTTFGFLVPGFFETTVGAFSSPASIALCIAAQNASSILARDSRHDTSLINHSSRMMADLD